jgi:hypothetical protein
MRIGTARAISVALLYLPLPEGGLAHLPMVGRFSRKFHEGTSCVITC